MAVRFPFPAALITLAACGGAEPGPGAVTPVLEARTGHAMAFDEARGRLLVFGGTGPEDGAPAADRRSLWAWDGQAWERLSTDGPTARHEASLVYDAARQRIVLYGGRRGTFPNEVLLDDTWEWDGAAWTERATSGPGARVHQAMAYDRARSRVVLFGGYQVSLTQELRDVWEWDGAAWTLTTAAVGADRIARALAYDESAPGSLVLLSVTAAGQVVTDTWNGGTVATPAVAAPDCPPPQSGLISLGAGGGLLFLGCADGGPDGTRRRTGVTWGFVAGQQPPPRTGHAMAWDRARGVAVLVGGQVAGGAGLNDVWEFDGTAWQHRGGTAPPQLTVGGTYATAVTILNNSCPNTVVQDNPTTVHQMPGDTTMSLSHAAISGPGVVHLNGAFSMPVIILNLGGVTYNITISGSFTAMGFTAQASLVIPGQCGYTVQWTGTKQGAPNVIPG